MEAEAQEVAEDGKYLFERNHFKNCESHFSILWSCLNFVFVHLLHLVVVEIQAVVAVVEAFQVVEEEESVVGEEVVGVIE